MRDNMDTKTRTKLHGILAELLDEFVRICEENNLVYFLTAGTLLGAVRHSGFIPWDDDIDIAMPRNDYEKFIDIINNSNNERYYLISYKSSNKQSKYCKQFAKFCKTGTVFAESYKNPDGYSGIFMDIFPFDNCVLFFAPLHTKLIIIIRNLCRIKANLIATRKKWKLFIGNIICCFFTEKFLNNLHRKLYLIFNKNKTRYISFFSGRYGHKRETHKYDEIFPLSKALFEGKYYSVPGNWDLFLKILYGNYMELPPVEERHVHSHEYIHFNDDETEE